jgi:ADP-heptose:LPS heptosyltransferase
VKKIIPDAMIDFSCDVNFMDAVRDHPLINEITDSKKTDRNEYLVNYETSVWTSNKYENHFGKNCKENRADIWAYYCGFKIENHNMNFNLKPQIIDDYKRKIEKFCTNKGKPIVLLAPIASVKTKSLLPEQIDIIKNELKDYNLVAIHHEEIPYCKENNIQGIYNTTITDWIYYTAVSDYVISVDTSTFHLAGGLKKPLMGIFTFANGKTYGKHYDFILVQKHIDNGDWDCGPCFSNHTCPKSSDINKPCLTELTSDDIIAGFTKLLNNQTQKIQPPIQIRHRLL